MGRRAIASCKAIVKQFADEIQRLSTRPYLFPYRDAYPIFGSRGTDISTQIRLLTFSAPAESFTLQKYGNFVFLLFQRNNLSMSDSNSH